MLWAWKGNDAKVNNKASEEKITMYVLEEEIQNKIAKDREIAEELEKQKIMEGWTGRAQRYLVGKKDTLQMKTKAKLMWSEVRTENISATGAVIISESKHAKGDTISVNLEAEMSNGYIEIRLSATVVDCQVNAMGRGYKTRVNFNGEPDDLFHLFLQKLGLREQPHKKL